MAAPIDYTPVKNASGLPIPAGGMFRVTGIDPDTGAFLIDLPDEDGDPAAGVVGDCMIPADGTGRGHWDPRAVAAFNRQDGAPAPGEQWGVQAGSFLLRKGIAGWEVLAGHGLGLVNVVRTYRTEEAGVVSGSGSGGGNSSPGSTLGYVCLGPFQTVAQCGYAPDGITPQLEVTTKYVTITATIENGRVRFGAPTESDEPCGGAGGGGGGDPEPSLCYDGEGEALAGHPDTELVADGANPYSGTHTLAWTGTLWAVEVTVEATVYRWELACAAGVWTLTLYVDEVEIRTGTAVTQAGDPFALTFLAADFSTDTDITVGLA